MTLKESLFNKGIYINTLRRFKWGSLLYFIILFLAAPFKYLTVTRELLIEDREYLKLLEDISLVLPVLLAMVVPTVTALLAFNFVHSQKQGIFTHSLPVSRKGNYISVLLASFSLMAVPVILTGLILLVMNLVGYSVVMRITDIFLWTAINLFVQFIMFSVAVFTSFLTGNSFAMVVINIIVYVIPSVSALAIESLGKKFFYGYVSGDVLDAVIESPPPVWFCTTLFSDEPELFFLNIDTWIYLLFALALYICAYFLYKNRKIELCGDVAGFKVMKPILKYTITAVCSVLCFATIGFIESSILFRIVMITLICAVFYFACEMVLRKSMRVFGSYKGFLVFGIACVCVICFCAFTNIFGFETYVPNSEKVSVAGIYSAYYNNVMPCVTDAESIKKVTEKHHKILENIPVTEDEYMPDREQLCIEYKLKNGRTVERRYFLDREFCDSIFSEMFEISEYKQNYFALTSLNPENITIFPLTVRCGEKLFESAVTSDIDKLFDALNADIDALTYENYKKKYPISIELTKNLSEEENNTYKVFKDYETEGRYYSYYFDIQITPEFKNTVAFLKEKGYYNNARESFVQNMYISTAPVETDEEKLQRCHLAEATALLETADAQQLFDETAAVPYDSDIVQGENYYVFCSGGKDEYYCLGSECFSFKADELPEYLRKYVSR